MMFKYVFLAANKEEYGEKKEEEWGTSGVVSFL